MSVLDTSIVSLGTPVTDMQPIVASRRPMHSVNTSVGTGYYPDVPRTEEEVLAVLNNQANNNIKAINDEVFPSIQFGR